MQTAGLGAASVLLGCGVTAHTAAQRAGAENGVRKPNVVFIFADQWRAQAVGYAGNKDVRTPHLDALATQSVNFANAVSGCPVCSPYRASLMTGQYWLTHGIFYNDKPLNPDAATIGKVYRQAGYQTAYIGKWHIDGHGRTAFIPEERRQGFEFWRVCECTHDYNHSLYYGDTPEQLYWPGYDAIAQTREAQKYIRDHANKSPFVLFMSWGPPHDPYETAPEQYRSMYADPSGIAIHPNVPESLREKARQELAGYYAHIAALDDCLGDILKTLEDCGIDENTIFVFTSDHGDMLYSHGQTRKQKPWEESVRIPFLLRYPAALGRAGKTIDMPINTPDIMPTLLGLGGIEIPDTVEGTDFGDVIKGRTKPKDNAALISCPSPFGQWKRTDGGREYRGVRTRRYTYVRDRNGPWLLYDNENDPHQFNNLCNKPQYGKLQKELEGLLSQKLKETNDEFRSGPEYIKQWGYIVDESGTVGYTN